jgi:hypothetical protein
LWGSYGAGGRRGGRRLRTCVYRNR